MTHWLYPRQCVVHFPEIETTLLLLVWTFDFETVISFKREEAGFCGSTFSSSVDEPSLQLLMLYVWLDHGEAGVLPRFVGMHVILIVA